MKGLFPILGAFVLTLAGCGSGSSPSSKSYVNTDGYPLETCLVTGEKLGSMGDPFVFKYQGKTVKFCCSSCIKEFNTDTAKFMNMLDEAQKKKDASAK